MRVRRNVLLAAGAFVLGLLGALFLLREPTEPLTREGLARAHDLWKRAGIRDYSLKYRMHGSVYEVEVKGGLVHAIMVNGLTPSIAQPGAYSIDGLFETLEGELDAVAEAAGPFAGQQGPVLRVRFHPKLGYPERYIRGGSGLGRGGSIEMLEFRTQG